jgi:hypothetical protein
MDELNTEMPDGFGMACCVHRALRQKGKRLVAFSVRLVSPLPGRGSTLRGLQRPKVGRTSNPDWSTCGRWPILTATDRATRNLFPSRFLPSALADADASKGGVLLSKRP